MRLPTSRPYISGKTVRTVSISPRSISSPSCAWVSIPGTVPWFMDHLSAGTVRASGSCQIIKIVELLEIVHEQPGQIARVGIIGVRVAPGGARAQQLIGDAGDI